MKNFTIISNEEYAVKKAGYVLDFEDTTHNCYEGKDISPETENKLMKDIDSFYDLDNACLCKDEDGYLYAVEFDFTTKQPVVWQRVIERIREKAYELCEFTHSTFCEWNDEDYEKGMESYSMYLNDYAYGLNDSREWNLSKDEIKKIIDEAEKIWEDEYAEWSGIKPRF